MAYGPGCGRAIAVHRWRGTHVRNGGYVECRRRAKLGQQFAVSSYGNADSFVAALQQEPENALNLGRPSGWECFLPRTRRGREVMVAA